MARATGKANREHPLLRQLSRICLSLPEAARRDLYEHADFRVRGKVFAYFLNNHHGDLRLDGEAVDWSEVKNLVELSYRLVAPQTPLLKK